MTAWQKPIIFQFVVWSKYVRSVAMSLSTNPLHQSKTAVDVGGAVRFHIRGLATSFLVISIAAFLAYLFVAGHALLSFWIAAMLFGLIFMAGVSKFSSAANPDDEADRDDA
jgi:hypothetical protein